MNKLVLFAGSVFICLLFSLLSFSMTYESNGFSNLRIVENYRDALEAGAIWGVFFGACVAPLTISAKKINRNALKNAAYFIVALLQAFVGFFVTRLFFYISQQV